MKIWMLTAAMLCLVAGAATADVTNEVFVGFQGVGTTKVTDAAGNDITDVLKSGHSEFDLNYTHFFSPLKDDEKPYELHRFYQRPSTLSLGLSTFGFAQRDSRVPIAVRETKRGESMLVLGGELYFSTGTGLFLALGGGSGKEKTKIAGIDGPDTDIKLGSYNFGVRQYIGPEFLLQLRFSGDSTETTVAGFAKDKSETEVVLIGGRGVIRDTIALGAELGGGSRKDRVAGLDVNYDVGILNLQGDVYVGKQFSFGLLLESETQKRTTQPEHKVTTGRSTLAFRYWFNEKVGLTLPFYGETVKDDTAGKMVSQGMGFYGTFRF
jgi:hypothetical protein